LRKVASSFRRPASLDTLTSLSNALVDVIKPITGITTDTMSGVSVLHGSVKTDEPTVRAWFFKCLVYGIPFNIIFL